MKLSHSSSEFITDCRRSTWSQGTSFEHDNVGLSGSSDDLMALPSLNKAHSSDHLRQISSDRVEVERKRPLPVELEKDLQRVCTVKEPHSPLLSTLTFSDTVWNGRRQAPRSFVYSATLGRNLMTRH